MSEHDHDHGSGPETEDPTLFWEGLYRERDQVWSGRPNAALVDLVADLEPGRALDLGSGEGADAIWLAEAGWHVTAVDISALAISRGQQAATERAIPTERIDWVAADLGSWKPTGEFDLVTASFLHSPVGFDRAAALSRALEVVAANGHFLLIGHAEMPAGSRHPEHELPTLEQELAGLDLDGSGWTVVVSEVRERPGTTPDGEKTTFRDNVILLRRNGG